MKQLDLNSNKERVILDFSSMGFKNIALLGSYHYNEAKDKLVMHKHDDMLEICFLERGHQYYKVGDKEYLLKGGDILITPPNVVHGTSGYREEKGSLFWMIIKTPKQPFSILNLSNEESFLLINQLLNLPVLHFGGTQAIKNILNQIFSVYFSKNNRLRRVELKHLILSFLIKVINCGKKQNKTSVSLDIEDTCNYIKTNVFQKLYIEKLAKRVYLSESRLKHKFKSEMGIPPNDYILKEKIKKAKEIIKQQQDVSFVDLAYDLGFSTSSYFSVVFKRYEGVTPSEFKLKK